MLLAGSGNFTPCAVTRPRSALVKVKSQCSVIVLKKDPKRKRWVAFFLVSTFKNSVSECIQIFSNMILQNETFYLNGDVVCNFRLKDLKYKVEVSKICAMIAFLGQREGKIHLPEFLVDMQRLFSIIYSLFSLSTGN